MIFFETFNPIVKHTTIRLIPAITISKNQVIRQLYVNNACLNGDLEEVEYMIQPQVFQVQSIVPMVYKSKKALYVLKYAPRAWF